MDPHLVMSLAHRIVLQGTRSSRALSFRPMQITMMQSPCRIGNHQPPGMSVKYHAHHVSCLTMSTSAANNPMLIDLRSDTLTQPTEKIRQAMIQAQTGDDVYHEDKDVKGDNLTALKAFFSSGSQKLVTFCDY